MPLFQALVLNGQAADAEKTGPQRDRHEKNYGPMYDVLYGQYMRSITCPRANS